MHPNHARFCMKEQRAYVEVLDDDAHVFVNGRDVLSSELQHNDQVKVGLKLKVIDETVVSSTASRLDQLLEHVDDNAETYDFATEDPST